MNACGDACDMLRRPVAESLSPLRRTVHSCAGWSLCVGNLDMSYLIDVEAVSPASTIFHVLRVAVLYQQSSPYALFFAVPAMLARRFPFASKDFVDSRGTAMSHDVTA
jgi:hypothetical protein